MVGLWGTDVCTLPKVKLLQGITSIPNIFFNNHIFNKQQLIDPTHKWYNLDSYTESHWGCDYYKYLNLTKLLNMGKRVDIIC